MPANVGLHLSKPSKEVCPFAEGAPVRARRLRGLHFSKSVGRLLNGNCLEDQPAFVAYEVGVPSALQGKDQPAALCITVVRVRDEKHWVFVRCLRLPRLFCCPATHIAIIPERKTGFCAASFSPFETS